VQEMLSLVADAILHRPHRLRFSFSLSFRASCDSSCELTERIDGAISNAGGEGASAGAVLLSSNSFPGRELHELLLDAFSSLALRYPVL